MTLKSSRLWFRTVVLSYNVALLLATILIVSLLIRPQSPMAHVLYYGVSIVGILSIILNNSLLILGYIFALFTTTALALLQVGLSIIALQTPLDQQKSAHMSSYDHQYQVRLLSGFLVFGIGQAIGGILTLMYKRSLAEKDVNVEQQLPLSPIVVIDPSYEKDSLAVKKLQPVS